MNQTAVYAVFALTISESGGFLIYLYGYTVEIFRIKCYNLKKAIERIDSHEK